MFEISHNKKIFYMPSVIVLIIKSRKIGGKNQSFYHYHTLIWAGLMIYCTFFWCFSYIVDMYAFFHSICLILFSLSKWLYLAANIHWVNEWMIFLCCHVVCVSISTSAAILQLRGWPRLLTLMNSFLTLMTSTTHIDDLIYSCWPQQLKSSVCKDQSGFRSQHVTSYLCNLVQDASTH